jgi:hypothetical protein
MGKRRKPIVSVVDGKARVDYGCFRSGEEEDYLEEQVIDREDNESEPGSLFDDYERIE